ncbi:hypothetical protein IVB69_12090 [Flavobacterium sp. J49]|uniref:hypothetical protein n=1 Tax=Flavobacterium sp. J49 TaxID=2718534 RepID=UPI001593D8F0|nr:hypothetical protein [Flavobacterium sp. J49]MBF6642225.1 hypothetical protein [Flavobacterium sp. J49]NIC03471.1 hypothetical protein [Flavobacterium sp. J49]
METQIYNQRNNSSRFSTYLAMCSFAIGTLILILYLLVPNSMQLLVVGFFYVLFALLFNGIVLLNLLYQFCIYPNERETLAIKMLIMLANIPIAVLYFFIAMHQNYSS